jgi:endonuclease/exonuclease/phosphatase (EEP) superfamily protein YafD
MQTIRPEQLPNILSLLRRRQPAFQQVLATQKAQERITELHNFAAFAHAAAAAAHERGDFYSAAELSKQAHTHSVNACQLDKKASGSESGQLPGYSATGTQA